MQSIYGFREAEVGLFLSARANGIAAVRPEPLTLSVNFRSSVGIVDWVNRALSQAFPETENVLTGAVTYEPSVPFRDDASDRAVRLHPILTDDPGPREARRVIEIIEEAQQENPDGTIAVLVLARSHLFQIVAALRQRQKQFRAVEIDALGERPVVRDLVSLTRALLHTGNRLAWLSILRAPWCGLRLEDLDALVRGEPTAAVWDLIRDPARQEQLSPDGRTRIERLIPLLGDALARRGRMPVRRWVESLWIALGGPACLETRAELEDAAACLDLLEQSTDGMQLRDETRFAEDVARLYAPSDVEAGEELQLMTIHKAKGLEFDTVILPGLGRRTRHDDPRLLRWTEYPDGDRSRLLLAPIPGAAGDKDALYDYLKSIDRKKRVHENTRLLYVAATRARKSLHLLGHTRLDPEEPRLKAPDSRSLLAKIWKTVEPEFSESLRDQVVVDEETVDTVTPEPPGVPLRRLTVDWAPPPAPGNPEHSPPGPRTPTPADVGRRTAAARGTVVQPTVGADRLTSAGHPPRRLEADWTADESRAVSALPPSATAARHSSGRRYVLANLLQRIIATGPSPQDFLGARWWKPPDRSSRPIRLGLYFPNCGRRTVLGIW